jgi:BlaI family transcriptional regulator, penicillinase repressor
VTAPQPAAPHLGDLETAIMDVIWAQGTATVRIVRDQLQRTPLPGYTTVATVMTRLVDKGLLLRARAGKTDLYRPAYDRAEYGRRLAGAAVRGLIQEYGDVALAQFAAALEQADPDRLARLRARVAPREEEAHA